jgi:hypothetical protein
MNQTFVRLETRQTTGELTVNLGVLGDLGGQLPSKSRNFKTGASG